MKVTRESLRELVREIVVEQMELIAEANSRDDFKIRITGMLSSIFIEWAQARICEANSEYPSGVEHWDNIEVPKLLQAFLELYDNEFIPFKDHHKAFDEVKPAVENVAPKRYRLARQHALICAQSLNRQLKNFKIDLNVDDLLVTFWEFVEEYIRQFSTIGQKRRSNRLGYKK